MAGRYGPQNTPRTQAAASDFSIGAPMTPFFRGVPGIAFETEPIQGSNSGSAWNGSGEGPQYSNHGLASRGNSQNGFPNSFNSFPASQMIQSGQSSSRGSIANPLRSQWTTDSGEAMSRIPSKDSTGAHSHRIPSVANSYDQSPSAGLYPNITQMSYNNISSARSDGRGRSISPGSSTLYDPTQQVDLQPIDQFTYPAGEDFTGNHPAFHGDSITDIEPSPSLTSGPAYNFMTATCSEETYGLTVAHDTVIYSSHPADEDSPIWGGSEYPYSRRSSPTVLDEWLPPPQMGSPTHSLPGYHSSPEPISPPYAKDSPYTKDFPDFGGLPPYQTGDRIVRKPMGPRPSKVASDLAAANRHQGLNGIESSEETLRFVGRSSLEIDNTARDHELYQNVRVHADGLYHCPWEGKEGCQHKPEKLKCNYDKFVDSHLKPYRCKVMTCENSRFSSTACLLRHEREAHAMHGHGDKPYLCTYEGCERGASGNGFPRQWNLRDHMKRVHNDPGPTSTGSTSPPPPTGPVKGKGKRKAEGIDTVPPTKAAKKSVTSDKAVRQPQESSLVDQYHQTKRKLLEVVNQLEDPRHSNNMDILRNASDCLKVMAQTTQRINSAPVLTGIMAPATFDGMRRTFSQQSG